MPAWACLAIVPWLLQKRASGWLFCLFSFQYCSTLLLPVLQLVFNCCHSNQLQVFLQKYRGTGYKKTIKRGRDKLSKWLYLSRASSLPFRRTPAASHFPFQPSYSFGDTWNSVFVLESCYSTFPVVIIICLLLSFQVPWCGDPPLQTGRYYV